MYPCGRDGSWADSTAGVISLWFFKSELGGGLVYVPSHRVEQVAMPDVSRPPVWWDDRSPRRQTQIAWLKAHSRGAVSCMRAG